MRFPIKNLFWIGPLFIMNSVYASVTNIESEFSGTLKTQVITETHFRHSADCYWEKKGIKQHDLGEQSLILNGGRQSLSQSGSLVWKSNLGTPFSRPMRDLTLQVGIENKVDVSELNLILTDAYAYKKAQFTQDQCTHEDGATIPKEASVSGSIKVHFQVPSQVWLVQISRSEFNGLFGKDSIKNIESVFNNNEREIKNEIIYLWVKPGSEIIFNLDFPTQNLASKNLFNLSLKFKPIVGAPINLTNLKKTLEASDLSSRLKNDSDAEDLMKVLLGVFNNTQMLQTELSKMELKDVTALNENLFKFANGIIKNVKLGPSLKTASAIAAYEISVGILNELSAYCKKIEIYLPFSDSTATTVGYRAAGFWLSRGLSVVKNYSFAPFEALLSELSMMQAQGFTFSAVFKDPKLKNKFKTSFDFIDRNVDMSHSPIISVQQAIDKTIKNLGSIGTSDDYAAKLLFQLKNLRLIEDEFFNLYDELEQAFRLNNNAIIDVTKINETLAQLKSGQSDIAENLEKNIRLLSINTSEDNDALFSKLTRLLSNQIALLEEPIASIPFFEKIRSEYFQLRGVEPVIATSKACVKGDVK